MSIAKIKVPFVMVAFIKEKLTTFLLDRVGHIVDNEIDNRLYSPEAKIEFESSVRQDVDTLSSKVNNLEAVIAQSLRIYDEVLKELNNEKYNAINNGTIIYGNVTVINIYSTQRSNTIETAENEEKYSQFISCIVDKAISNTVSWDMPDVSYRNNPNNDSEPGVIPGKNCSEETMKSPSVPGTDKMSIREYVMKLAAEADKKVEKIKEECQ